MDELSHKSITTSYEMYDITDGNQQLIEATPEDKPLQLMTDFGMMPIQALEDKLKKTAAGETFELTLKPDEAFGEYVPERVVDIDKNIFLVNGEFDQVHVHIGAIIPLQNEQGERFLAQVVEISEDKVKVDLNHPLAGRTLKFRGTVTDNHDATQDEIMALLNQLNHHGCGGCGGGNCSGNCGHCGEGEGECAGHCGEGGCGNCK